MLIAGRFFIPDYELVWEFIASSGPGGQNVNKVATAVRLRFNLVATTALPPEIREKLLVRLAGKLNAAGELAVTSQEFRTQLLNRREAAAKLSKLLEAALTDPKVRRPTRPTTASVKRRLTAKKHQSAIKKSRSDKPSDQD